MVIKFPKLTDWQQDVFDYVKDSKGKGYVFTVRAKRQLGKTVLAAISLIYYAVTYPGCINHIVEPSNVNNRNVYRLIKKWLFSAGIVDKFNDSTNEIFFTNGSEIRFLSAESRDSLRGQTTTGLLVIDEMAYIRDDVIQLVLPYTDVHNASMLCLSTPFFKEGLYYKFYSNPDNVKSFSFNWTDSKYDTSKFITKEKLEFYRKTLTDMKFRTEVLGEFLEDGGYVFKNILNCIKNKDAGVPIYGGLDFAIGNGGDYTALILMDANKNIHSLYYFNDLDPTVLIKRLSEIINLHKSLKAINAEQNSIGSVYISQLKNNLTNKSILKSFHTDNTSKRRIIENLSLAFQNEDISIIDDSELIKLLLNYAQLKLTNGYTYNAVTGSHDDLVMSLAMCYDLFNKHSYNFSMI